MVRLVCEKCKKVWYTSDTRDGQKCDDCGGELVKKDEVYEKVS